MYPDFLSHALPDILKGAALMLSALAPTWDPSGSMAATARVGPALINR